MENQSPNTARGIFTSITESITLKFVLIGILTLIMLIPLFFLQNLIEERNFRHKEVKKTITNKWGKAVVINGPILMVPYKENDSNKIFKAYFYPNSVEAKVQAKMQEPLKFGMYKTNVFTSDFSIKGELAPANFQKENIADSQVLWNQAKIIVEVNSLKGLNKEVIFNMNNQKITLEPNVLSNDLGQLESPAFDARTILNTKYQFNIGFNATDSITIAPIGKTTKVDLKSDWHSPGFVGNYSPQNRNVSSKGFEANWNVLHSSRPFKQEHFKSQPNFADYQITTTFVTPVDEYQQNERVSKYGFLVIGLTFLVFFIIQILNRININMFHYTMIGLALIMFYTLLLSISEHSSFNLAYIVASIAVIGMIGLFSSSILGSKKFALFVSGALTVIYTFIFTIIQLEDYALLAGSIGLFIILGIIMYVSRKINWTNQ